MPCPAALSAFDHAGESHKGRPALPERQSCADHGAEFNAAKVGNSVRPPSALDPLRDALRQQAGGGLRYISDVASHRHARGNIAAHNAPYRITSTSALCNNSNEPQLNANERDTKAVFGGAMNTNPDREGV